MPTDTVRGTTLAAEFALRGAAWSLGFFGLLRLPWSEAHVVLPAIQAQAAIASRLFGAPALPVEATLACSGADAIALCLGAIIAYPVGWRARLGGAAGGLCLILALNTARIGTLGRAAAEPALFDALHLYAWPAVLTLAIAGYVFAWMRVADLRSAAAGPGRSIPRPWRFVACTALFVVLFSAVSPFLFASASVLALAAFVARAAAATLGALGATVHASGNVLWTTRGGFAVTQECISTPLIAVYLGAACTWATSWRQLVPAVLATVPLFTALAIARLLVVALPGGAVTSPLFFVHAFYQLLLAAVVVLAVAIWRHPGSKAAGYAACGAIAGILFIYLLGDFYTRAIAYHARGPLEDPQGALAFLPSFQAGLYIALSVAALAAVWWKRVLVGLAALAATQAAGFASVYALTSYPDLALHVRDVRACAVAVPVIIFAAVVHGAAARR